MDDQQKKLAKQWIDGWKTVGPILERERLLNLSLRSLEDDIELFDSIFENSAPSKSISTTSGLVEMQSYFKKARR